MHTSHTHANSSSSPPSTLSYYKYGLFLKLLTSTEKVNLDADLLDSPAGIKVSTLVETLEEKYEPIKLR